MLAFIDADGQAIYLGTIRRDDLIRAVGRFERLRLVLELGELRFIFCQESCFIVNHINYRINLLLYYKPEIYYTIPLLLLLASNSMNHS